MSVLQAIVLGIVQGLTEFLPVSSSGHLILVPYLLDWDPQDLTFDLALHAGTLLAVLLYFVRDWWTMFTEFFGDLGNGRRGWSVLSQDSRMLVLLAIGSVPAGVAGVVLSDAEDALREPGVVAAMLVVIAGVMWFAERVASQSRRLEELGPNDAIFTGVAQALALVPGTSRSGITISAGLFRGFDRSAATRFSFLLSTPVIAGAALFTFADAALGGEDTNFEVVPFLLGAVAAGIVGLLAIHYLLRYLRFNTLRVFIGYRVVLAVVVLIVAAVR